VGTECTGDAWDSDIALLHPDDHEESCHVLSTDRDSWRGRFRVPQCRRSLSLVLERCRTPLRGSDGKLLYWMGVNLDIGDAKRAEKALNATKEKLARASQMATVAELSAPIAELVQTLSAVVSSARAELHWLSRDVPNLERAKRLIEAVLRDSMSIADVIHKTRRL